MVEIEAILTPEIIGLIATVILSIFGVQAQKLKSKLSVLKDLTIDVNDALYDNEISVDEIKKISDKLRKLANA